MWYNGIVSLDGPKTSSYKERNDNCFCLDKFSLWICSYFVYIGCV